MGILMLGAEEGTCIHLKITGSDAKEAIVELERILLEKEQDLMDLK